ncbi:threonine/serine exporter family protein [Pseudoglutamicibacter albus]|uniref:threonine/serine ThrE exporter family protein n=1 Tax=Pseudoglutamicibacter albus TaxID=98671 RepID=UPI001EF5D4D2|nr:threonine/serine exporter family protein [Pseudoglutamicibacter albus]MCG7304485.1 threonine/serine exporter family protein [Pseudoglutamicibacter albus]
MSNSQNPRQPQNGRDNKNVPSSNMPSSRPHQTGNGPSRQYPSTFDLNIPLPAVPPPSIRGIRAEHEEHYSEETHLVTRDDACEEATDPTHDSTHRADTSATSVWTVAQRQGSILRSLEAAQISEEQTPAAGTGNNTDTSNNTGSGNPTGTASLGTATPADAPQPRGISQQHGVSQQRGALETHGLSQPHKKRGSRGLRVPHRRGKPDGTKPDGTNTDAPRTTAENPHGRKHKTKPHSPEQHAVTAPLVRGLRGMIQGEAPATTTFNIVDRLIGSPFEQAAARTDPQAEAEKEAENVRRAMRFALDIAELMLRWGSGAQEVETAVIAVTASCGLRHVDMDITNQSIHLNWTPPEGMPVSVMRVVRSFSDNYKSLAALHQLVSDISAGRVEMEAAQARMRAIRRYRHPYSAKVTFIGSLAFATLFVVFIGGGWRAATAVFFTQAFITTVTRLNIKWRVPEFFNVASSTLLATIIALVLYNYEIINNPEMVVAGGLMLILPAGRFVSAVQDAIYGFPLTAVSRLFSALIIYAAIITGVMAGAYVAGFFNLSEIDLARPPAGNNLPFWVLALLAVFAVLSGAVIQQVAPRHLIAIALVVLAGYSTFWIFANTLNVGPRATPAVAATVMGLLARLLAQRLNIPSLILIVPSVIIILPGLAIFRSMYAMVQQAEGISTSIAGMVVSFSIIMAIAVGAAFGDLLARPFTSAHNRATKQRFRRR